METKANGATSNRQYEDFEPYCRWLREEGQDTLEIDVNGLKKDQLKVQTNTKKVLTIHGEKPMDTSNNKWTRFHKEIRLSREINVDEISAKFSKGVLSVVMPKTVQSWNKTPNNEAMKKDSNLLGAMKIRKRTAIKVAIVVALVVTLVALGTYAARVVNNRYSHGGAGKVDML